MLRNKSRMKQCLAILLVCMMVVACGCADNTKKAEPKKEKKVESTQNYTFTDDLGRKVTVNHPKRVACLISSFSDIWALAGGVDQIVAATDATWRYLNLPLKEDVVNLGSSKELNLEELVACEPDFVLASCGTERNLELEQSLEQMGINVGYFSVDNFKDYLRVLKICTEITGCVENYEKNGTDVEKQVEKAKKRVDGSNPSALYIRATGSSCKVKDSKDSVLGEMMADLGCVNIADKENSLLEQLSMEKILEEDPEYIFVVLQSADPKEAEGILESTLLSNPAWKTLRAVKNGHYYVMDPNLYNLKPNARWGEAYEKLADILYPKA